MPSTGARSFQWANATQGIQGQLVKMGTAGKVDRCTAITDVPIGVLLNQPKQNETAQIDYGFGCGGSGAIVLMLLDGTTDISIADHLKTSGTGRGIKCATFPAASYTTTVSYTVGVAIEAFTTDGDGLVPVLMRIYNASLT